jgi:hypothetical protein
LELKNEQTYRWPKNPNRDLQQTADCHCLSGTQIWDYRRRNRIWRVLPRDRPVIHLIGAKTMENPSILEIIGALIGFGALFAFLFFCLAF